METDLTRKQIIFLGAQIIALTMVSIVIMGIGSQFIPAPDPANASADAGSQTAAPLALILGLQFLQTVALAYLAIRSRWSGLRLIGSISVLYFCTATALTQIETIVYLDDVMEPGMQTGIILMGLFAAVVFPPILVFTLRGWQRRFPADEKHFEPLRTDRSLRWKLPLGGAIYLAFYYLFGYYVAWQSPELRDFYQGTDPGSFLAQMGGIVRDTPWMLPFQFLRGLCWALLGLLGVRMMRGQWWEAGLALSLIFTVPSLYLLVPNPIMPETIRIAHLIETVPYQFAYGWLAAFLFGWRQRNASLATVLT